MTLLAAIATMMLNRLPKSRIVAKNRSYRFNTSNTKRARRFSRAARFWMCDIRAESIADSAAEMNALPANARQIMVILKAMW